MRESVLLRLPSGVLILTFQRRPPLPGSSSGSVCCRCGRAGARGPGVLGRDMLFGVMALQATRTVHEAVLVLAKGSPSPRPRAAISGGGAG